MIEAVYSVCRTSANIREDIAWLFYKNGWTSLYERGFSTEVADKLEKAFEGVPGVNVAFASTLKAGGDGVSVCASYGQVYFDFPREAQERILAQTLAAARVLESMQCGDGSSLHFRHHLGLPQSVEESDSVDRRRLGGVRW